MDAGDTAYFLISVASANMPNHSPVDVYYTTQDGTDIAGIDYTPTYGDKELTFKYNGSGYTSQIVEVTTVPTANNGTFSICVPCCFDSNAPTPTETESVSATIANGTWTNDGNWSQDPKTLAYSGTTTATGGPASLEQLALYITGRKSDWTLLREDPANKYIGMVSETEVPAGTKVQIGKLLEVLDQRLHTNVKDAANATKYATFPQQGGKFRTSLRLTSIRSIWFLRRRPRQTGRSHP